MLTEANAAFTESHTRATLKLKCGVWHSLSWFDETKNIYSITTSAFITVDYDTVKIMILQYVELGGV